MLKFSLDQTQCRRGNILYPNPERAVTVELEEKEENVPRCAVGSVVVFVCSIEEQPLVFGF